MTPIDRAAHITKPLVPFDTFVNAFQPLLDAGLLAPDLPEPEPADAGALTWAESNVWVEDDEPIVCTGRPREWSTLTPDEARKVAHALLAAADYAEVVE